MRPAETVEVRIVKRPPAPMMDGFDMRGLEVGQVYRVSDALGRYLVSSCYASYATADMRSLDRANDKAEHG